jgi:hypothetical protein
MTHHDLVILVIVVAAIVVVLVGTVIFTLAMLPGKEDE